MHLVYIAQTKEDVELLAVCQDVSGHENAAQEVCQRYVNERELTKKRLLWITLKDQVGDEWMYANCGVKKLMISNAVKFGEILND